MIVSEARREANRRNALKSTGPRTEEGKERSRRNALTHGLSAEVVLLPEDEAVAAAPGVAEGSAGLPKDWSGWLAEEVAVITTRIRRCDRLDAVYRRRVVCRAEFHWDDDRRLEVEFLGSGIAKDPAAVARELRMTPQGCDWMIDRWSRLARAADRDGAWTPEQTAIAFDLLGTPRDFRGGSPGDLLDLEAAPGSSLAPAVLARREVAALTRRKEEVAGSDDFERSVAQADAIDDAEPDLRKLRRHESDLHRRLRWCVAQLGKVEATAPSPVPVLVPTAVRPPAPAPRAEALPEPIEPDDLDRLEAMLARADAGAEALPSRPLPDHQRPDPRAALERAKKESRRLKRDGRRG